MVNYETPKMVIVQFEEEDIITASGETEPTDWDSGVGGDED